MESKELRIGNLTECFINGELKNNFHVVDADDLKTIDYYNWYVLKKIPLTEELLLKFGFEFWGEKVVNEFEKYKRYVLYNVVGGTSNYEVHIIESCYGGEIYKEIVFSIDNDERQHVKETDYVHNLQNHFYLVSGFDLNI